MIGKYRSKVKEGKTRNANNLIKHINKLKEIHSEDLNSNEFDSFLKCAEKPTTNENRQIHLNYQKSDYYNYHRSCNRSPQRF